MGDYWNNDRYSDANMHYPQQDLFLEPPQTPIQSHATQRTYLPASMDDRAFLYDSYPNSQRAPYSEPASHPPRLYHFGDVQSSPLQQWDENREVQLPPLTGVRGRALNFNANTDSHHLFHAQRQNQLDPAPPIQNPRVGSNSDASTTRLNVVDASIKAPSAATRPTVPNQKENENTTDAPKRKKNTKTTAKKGKAADGGVAVENSKPSKPQGTGALSGVANRRDKGGSDDEVEKLTPKQKEEAKIKVPVTEPNPERKEGKNGKLRLSDHDKLRVVKYILQPSVYSTFKLKTQDVYNKIVQTVLLPPNSFAFGQVKNYFEGLLKKYKSARNMYKRPEHTGGGDGDADRMPKLNTDPEDGEKDDDDEGDDESEVKAPLRGKKTEFGFSAENLSAFMKTEIYRLLDDVLGNDDSIIRTRNFNSTTPVSDSEDTQSDDDSSDDKKATKRKLAKTPSLSTAKKPKVESGDVSSSKQGMIQDAVSALSSRARAAEEIARAEYDLNVKKEQREVAKDKREAAKEERDAKLIQAQLQDVEVTTIDRLFKIDNPAAQAAAQRLLDELVRKQLAMAQGAQ